MSDMSKTPWRDPDAETEDYPNLVVHDGRVSGSITTGHSRLPLWAFAHVAITDGWDEVEKGWSPTESYGFTDKDFAEFVYCLLEQRGEFGRLLCVLADVERREQKRDLRSKAWWERKKDRKRVREQLERCLAKVTDA